MLLICAFLGGGGGGLEKCSGDRTAGLAVQYHGVGFFFFLGGGLVNIMQPRKLHNKIEEAGLYFFLCVVFLFHLL